MTINDQEMEARSVKFWKRGGIAGISFGFLAIVLCELPIILAVAGIGGFGATALAFRPTLLMELIAIALLAVGSSVLIYLAYQKRKSMGLSNDANR